MSASNNQTATVGTSYIIKCSGTNLAISDIVWLYYPVGNSSFTNIIYSDAAYTPGSDLRYEVKSIPTSANTIITNLMIKSVTLADAGFVYQCACNVYKEACTSDTKLVAEVKLKAVTTTTTTTTTSTTTSDLTEENKYFFDLNPTKVPSWFLTSYNNYNRKNNYNHPRTYNHNLEPNPRADQLDRQLQSDSTQTSGSRVRQERQSLPERGLQQHRVLIGHNQPGDPSRIRPALSLLIPRFLEKDQTNVSLDIHRLVLYPNQHHLLDKPRK